MSNLIFIPPAASSKPAQKFKSALFSEKTNESGASSFEQFLKGANESQFETDQYQDKLAQLRLGENKAKPEPKNGKVKTADRSSHNEAEQSNPVRETVGDGAVKDRSQATDADEGEIAAESQKTKTSVNHSQEEILALLAHLAEAEAVIRGETQPETIQSAGLAEVMTDPDLLAAIQGKALPVQPDGANLGVVKMAPVVETLPTDTAEPDTDILPTDTAELKLLSPDARLNAAIIKPDPEAVTEGGTLAPNQVGQVMQQNLSAVSSLAENSLSEQEKNSGEKSRLSESVKVSFNNVEIKNDDQSFGKMVFGENEQSQMETGTQLGEQQAPAEHGLASVSKGKVNLAVLQTQLAVNDELKTEIPVLNVIPGQPVPSSVSQIQASGSSEVASANKEELFSQIVEQAQVVINNGGSEMEVNLKPEHLGRLQLKVTIENEVVTAKFVAESQQVKEIIESNLGQLKRSLLENGMQVDTIMVSVGYQQSNESFDQAAYNRDGFKNCGGEMGATNDGRETEVEERNSPVEHDGLIDLIA